MPFDPNKCFGQVTGGWGRKSTSNIFWIIPLDIFSGPKMEGPEALHQLMKSGVSLAGLGGRELLEETLGRGPHPQLRQAGRPARLSSSAARPGPPSTPRSTVSKHPPRPAADTARLGVPGSEISKTKFNTIEQYNPFQRPLTSPRPPLSAGLWQRDSFPGSPGCSGRDSPLPEFPRPGPESLIELRRLGA